MNNKDNLTYFLINFVSINFDRSLPSLRRTVHWVNLCPRLRRRCAAGAHKLPVCVSVSATYLLWALVCLEARRRPSRSPTCFVNFNSCYCIFIVVVPFLGIMVQSFMILLAIKRIFRWLILTISTLTFSIMPSASHLSEVYNLLHYQCWYKSKRKLV